MATVTVKCNIPNGIVIQAYQPVTVQVPVLGGGMREITEHHPVGERITIRGPAVPRIHDENFVYPVVDRNGFAVTQGVDAEVWKNWLEANKKSAMIVNGCVYAVEDKDAQKADNQHRGITSGAQPLARDGDVRMPKRKPAPNVSAGQGER